MFTFLYYYVLNLKNTEKILFEGISNSRTSGCVIMKNLSKYATLYDHSCYRSDGDGRKIIFAYKFQ